MNRKLLCVDNQLKQFLKECKRTGLRTHSFKFRGDSGIWQAVKEVSKIFRINPVGNFTEFCKNPNVFRNWWMAAYGRMTELEHGSLKANPQSNPKPKVQTPKKSKVVFIPKHKEPSDSGDCISAKLFAIKSPNAFTKHDREAFFKSQQWKEARYQVFLRDGKVCACCGVNGPGIVFHIDHIRPLWTNPELALDLTNLQVMCSLCNEGKGALDSTDWRKNAKPQASMEEP